MSDCPHHWISVKDRLPEEDQWVLVWLVVDGRGSYAIDKYHSDNHYRIRTWYWPPSEHETEPKFWMPLPQAPGGELL